MLNERGKSRCFGPPILVGIVVVRKVFGFTHLLFQLELKLPTGPATQLGQVIGVLDFSAVHTEDVPKAIF